MDETHSAPATPAANDTAHPAPASSEAAEPSITETMAGVWDKHNPPREGDGRFEAATNESSTDQPARAAAELAKAPAIGAPHAWSAEMKDKFATLPPEVQTYVSQRERDAHEAISRAGQQVRQFEPIRSVLERFDGAFRRNNLPPAEGIARLLAVEEALDANPRAAIAEIARAYGVDLQGAPATQEAQLIAGLQAELAQIKGHLTGQERAAQMAVEADFTRTADAASRDLPHFAEVKSIMMGLIQSGAVPEGPPAEMIKTAYEQAVYAKPETRERVMGAEAERRSTAVRKAASLNARPAAGGAPAAARSMRESMEAVAAKYGLT